MQIVTDPVQRIVAQTKHHTAAASNASPSREARRKSRLLSVEKPHYLIALRLQEARQAAGFATASDAARAMKVNEISYLHHENGRRKAAPEVIAYYANAFRVSPSYLLFGGEPHQVVQRKATIAGAVEAGGFVRAVKTPRSVTIPDIGVKGELIGFEVRTNDLWPVYDVGDMGFYDPEDLQLPITSRVEGLECLVTSALGDPAIRRITKVHRDGTVDLLVYGSDEDPKQVRIRGAAPIRMIIRKPVG